MSVVIVVPGQEDWFISGRGYRLLKERADGLLDGEADREVLYLGGLHGLFFDSLPHEQARRLALAVQRAAESLRFELRRSSDGRDQEFAEHLERLALSLTELAGTGEE